MTFDSNAKSKLNTVEFVYDEFGQTHVVNTLKYFKEFTYKEEKLQSRFGVDVVSKGYGLVQIQIGPSKRTVWLSEVRYVPEVKGCVFSRDAGCIWGLPTQCTPLGVVSAEDQMQVIGYVDDLFARAFMLKLKVFQAPFTNFVGEKDMSENSLQKVIEQLRSAKVRKTVDPWNLRFLAVLED